MVEEWDKPQILDWSNRWVKELIQNNPIVDSSFETQAMMSSDLTAYPILLNDERLSALLSCIMLGADLLYPDTSHEKMLWFLEGLGMDANFCLQVADCIENSTYVQNALDAWFAGTEWANRLDKIQELLNGKMIIEPVGAVCEDANFGAIRAVIEELDLSIVDFFEQIEVATNVAEMVEQISEITLALSAANPAIGVTASIVINSVASLVDQVLESIQEQYLAGQTQELKDEFSCEIFCQFGCDVTLENIRAYFRGRLATQVEFNNIVDIFDFIVAGAFVAETTVVAMYFCTFEMIYLANSFFSAFVGGLSPAISRLQLVAQMGANTGDANHAILCDCNPAETFSLMIAIRTNNLMGWSGSWYAGSDTKLYSSRYANNNRWYVYNNLTVSHGLKITRIIARTRIDEIIRSTSYIGANIYSGVDRTGALIEYHQVKPLMADNIPDGAIALGMRDYIFDFTADNSAMRSVMVEMYHSVGGNLTGSCGLEYLIIEGIGNAIQAQTELGGSIL